MAGEKDVTLTIGADTSALNSGMKDAQDTVRDAAENIRGIMESAFQFAGIDIAVESIKRLGETIKSLSDSAIEMRTMSDVIGVTTAQFQTMELAAEEVGVGVDIFARAAEKLRLLLNEAHEGSGKAIESLHKLGITNEELADPTFKINDLLNKLHDGLLDANTATELQNALLEVLGARAVKAVEAIKAYEGSQKGVAAAMKTVNGLSDEQINKLSSMGHFWSELWTSIEHASGKIVIAVHDAMAAHNDLDDSFSEQRTTLSGGVDTGAQQAAAKQLATMKVQLLQLVTAEDLRSEQAQIAATAEGTAKRLALAKGLFEDSKIYYGSANVDEVRKAFAQMEGAQRAFDRSVMDGQRQQIEAARQVSADKVREWQKSIREMEESQREFTKDIEDQFREQVDITMAATKEGSLKRIQDLSAEAEIAKQKFGEQSAEYQAMVAKIVAASRQYGTDQQKQIEQLSQSWLRFSNNVANTMTQSFMGMLTRTRSFSQSMVQMFDSMAEKVIGSLVRIGVQQAVQAATGIAAQRTAQQESVLIDAKKAAGGAYSALAGIPYIGPFIAPVAAAVAFAGVEAFSASGGFDIPSGLSPVTQLHPEEMVLPAHLANPLRDALANGGAGAMGRGSGHTFNISSPDAKSVERLFMNNSGAVASALKRHISRGGGR